MLLLLFNRLPGSRLALPAIDDSTTVSRVGASGTLARVCIKARVLPMHTLEKRSKKCSGWYGYYCTVCWYQPISIDTYGNTFTMRYNND